MQLLVQGYNVRSLKADTSLLPSPPTASGATPNAINILNLHLGGHFDMRHGMCLLHMRGLKSKAVTCVACCRTLGCCCLHNTLTAL